MTSTPRKFARWLYKQQEHTLYLCHIFSLQAAEHLDWLTVPIGLPRWFRKPRRREAGRLRWATTSIPQLGRVRGCVQLLLLLYRCLRLAQRASVLSADGFHMNLVEKPEKDLLYLL